MAAKRLLLILLAACGARPQPLVICHNSHCAPGDGVDDTLDALDASLALGDTVFDGIEVDFAYNEPGGCVFSHAPDPDAPPYMAPIDRIAPWVANHGTPSGEPFVLYIELKPDGTPPPDQMAQCALHDAARAVPSAQVVVSSFSGELTNAYAQLVPGATVAAEMLPPTRTDLSTYHPLNVVSVDPLEIDHDTLDRYRDMGLDIALWGDRYARAARLDRGGREPATSTSARRSSFAHGCVTDRARAPSCEDMPLSPVPRFARPDPQAHPAPTPPLASLAVLTARQRAVAELVTRGLTNAEIARLLGISSHTVKKHLGSLFARFDVSNRTELAGMIGFA